jgi:hypothetical protein
VSIQFVAPDGTAHTKALQREAPDAKIEWVNTPEDSLPPFSIRWLKGSIAYMELNTFQDDVVVKNLRST